MSGFSRIRDFTGLAVLGIGLAIALYVAIIPIRLAIAHSRTPMPQLALTLGGGTDREEFAATFARHHPHLDIWVSSGSAPSVAAKIFEAAGTPLSRVRLTHRATDTVTNFTTTVELLQQQRIEHIYLITSDFHMKRARAIAFWVLGSRGIAYTPIEVPSDGPSAESSWRIGRDVGRSLLWLATGKTGASFGLQLQGLFRLAK